jgi:hypothetical protein
VKRHAKTSFAGLIQRRPSGHSRLALAALALFALVAFLGSSVPAASADECPNQDLRVGFSAQLPECRAYERVTPADKNGADIVTNGTMVFGADYVMGADAPGAVAYPTWNAFGDAAAGALINTYVARRTASGWQSHGINPPLKAGFLTTGFLRWGLTNDLTQGILEGPSKSGVLSGRLNLIDTTSRETTFIATAGNNVNANSVVAGYANDMSHVVVWSFVPLTPDSPSGNENYLYDWTESGGLVNVGRLPDNSLAPGDVQMVTANETMYHPVSDDGSRIFFTTGGQLYVRENGNSTTRVSAPAPGAPVEADQPATFRFASADGSNVFFCSSQRLTADSTAIPGSYEGQELYRYQFGSGTLTDLTVTDDPEGAGICADFPHILGAAEDASRLYFLSRAQLTDDAPDDTAVKIYVWHDDGTAKGELTYVTSMSGDLGYYGSGQERTGARVSSNGRWLAFLRESEGGPDPQGGEIFRIFRYDAIAKELVCASCNPNGLTHSFFHREWFEHEADSRFVERTPRNLLDDGRLFFESRDALVPEDINNDWDVYEYLDGQRHLISSGTDGTGAPYDPSNWSHRVYFGDASLDGTDVYLETRTQLVPSDTDELIDLYTARVDGGFKSDLAPPPPNCNGEACKPPPATASVGPGAGSAVFAGSGNQGREVGRPARKRRRCGKHKGARKCQKARHVNANRGGSK